MSQPNVYYLDYNASAPLRPEARLAMEKAMDLMGNPSAIHQMGRKSRALVDEARDAIAQSMNVAFEQVIFTSGGSESNNMAVKGASLVTSAGEHSSLLKASHDVRHCKVKENGQVDLDDLEKHLSDLPNGVDKVVGLAWVNHEHGVIQPIEKVIQLAKKYGARTHIDACQAIGKLPGKIDFNAMGIDTMAISGHKIGAPKGIGALIMNPKIHLSPLIAGAGQERGYRAGTENVIGIAGLKAAVEVMANDNLEQIQSLRDAIEKRLLNVCPDMIIFGASSSRVGHMSLMTMPGVNRHTQLMHFDLKNIGVSAGSACSSGKLAASHVLLAMNVKEKQAMESIRMSFGYNSCQEDADAYCLAWEDLYKRKGLKAAV
jgi:cysteine desulfurase